MRQIVSTWAPSTQNPTETLIARAAKITGFAPDQALNVSDPATKAKLIEATIRNEQGGRLPVDPGIIAKVAGAAPPATQADSGPAAPDLDRMLATVQHRVDTNQLTPEEGDRASAVITHRYHEWSQQTAQQRTQLLGDTANGIAVLASGRDWTPDPVALRALLPADKADAILQQIGEAREQGNARNQVQWASPAELNGLTTRAQAGLDSGQDFARRQRYAQVLSNAIVARNKALDDDPAAFVAAAPAVAAAQHAIDPQNPAPGTQAAIQASLAEQEWLGVAPEDRRVLPKGEAASMVRQIISSDPAKTDIGPALEQTAENYGDYWPQAFGDLVKAGLPPEAQILAAMAPVKDEQGRIKRDDQAAPRADFQRMLATMAEKGGYTKLKEVAPHDAVQAIGQGLDDVMAPFRATVRDPKLYDAVRSGVEQLAYYYAFRGRSGDAALRDAYDGIIDRKYDFDGSVRAPKGELPQVERFADQVLAPVRPGDLPDIGGNPDLTRAQRQDVYFDAIRNGEWRVNHDDTGLIRMARFKNGTMIPATRRDGRPIEIKFKDAATAPPPSLSAGGGAGALDLPRASGMN
ncbi:MAG TPA: hypothetical protein VHY35_07265 [Stellaceae bacterium]|nr:hypothetical protein [Stellaceae bacterium]